jgi:hypothetical protein
MAGQVANIDGLQGEFCYAELLGPARLATFWQSAAGEGGHAPLKRGLSGQAIVLGRDNRRVSNGHQVSRITALALKRGKSVDFTGYWQRHVTA